MSLMCRRSGVSALLFLLPNAVSGAGGPSTEKGTCEFANEPIDVGYYWDPSCKLGMLGCLADGKSVECRMCGSGNFTNPCPPSSCHFPGGEPETPYYWDYDCKMGMLGCWADGVHAQCRFCGLAPFTGLPCPENRAAPPRSAACAFKEGEEPEAPHFWDPSCKVGDLGCLADGKHKQCRYCGVGDYEEIACPADKVCTFAAEPTIPYYWDPECEMGKVGCMADGVHKQCRFCAARPFEDIECPEIVAPEPTACVWPHNGEPSVPFYWEPACVAGVLGCWADGMHAQCRFCGRGAYTNVTCPASASVPLEEREEARGGAAAEGEAEDEDQDQGEGEDQGVRVTGGSNTPLTAKDIKAFDTQEASDEEEPFSLSGAPPSLPTGASAAAAAAALALALRL